MDPIRMDRKYQTRDGRPVRILCVDANRDCRIVGLVLSEKGKEELIAWYPNGNYMVSSYSNEYDLINAKTKKEGWVNIYPDESCIVTQGIHDSKEKADAIRAFLNRTACVKIEWEE